MLHQQLLEACNNQLPECKKTANAVYNMARDYATSWYYRSMAGLMNSPCHGLLVSPNCFHVLIRKGSDYGAHVRMMFRREKCLEDRLSESFDNDLKLNTSQSQDNMETPFRCVRRRVPVCMPCFDSTPQVPISVYHHGLKMGWCWSQTTGTRLRRRWDWNADMSHNGGSPEMIWRQRSQLLSHTHQPKNKNYSRNSHTDILCLMIIISD